MSSDVNHTKKCLQDLITYRRYAALSSQQSFKELRILACKVREIEDGNHDEHQLPKHVSIRGEDRVERSYDTVKVERRMNSITRPWMLKLSRSGDETQPSKRWILKPEDIGREACAMEVIASLNQEWEAGGIKACGQKVHAKTYRMLLVGPDDSLVEVVEKCVTLGKLKRTSGTMSNIINSISQSDSRPGTRARRYLQNDSTRLDKLAASTAAFLACSYLLGIGDGHGDNLMLTEDGELFRIDFGFLFGAGPLGPDAPVVWLPWTVQEALGPRMHEVIEAAREAVRTVLRRPGVLKASVFAAAFAGHPSPEAYVAGLSLEDFNQKVSSLGTFDLFKSAKDLFHDVGYCGIPRWPQRPEINTKSPAALAFLMSRSDAEIRTPESLAEFAEGTASLHELTEGADDIFLAFLAGSALEGLPHIPTDCGQVALMMDTGSSWTDNCKKYHEAALQQLLRKHGLLQKNGPLDWDIYSHMVEEVKSDPHVRMHEMYEWVVECVHDSVREVRQVVAEWMHVHCQEVWEWLQEQLGNSEVLQHLSGATWFLLAWRVINASWCWCSGSIDDEDLAELLLAAVLSKGVTTIGALLFKEALILAFPGFLALALVAIAAPLGCWASRSLLQFVVGTGQSRSLEKALAVLDLPVSSSLWQVEERYLELYHSPGRDNNDRQVHLAFFQAGDFLMRNRTN